MKDAIITYRELVFRGLGLCVAVLIGGSVAEFSLAEPLDDAEVTVNGKLKIVQIDNEPGAPEQGEWEYQNWTYISWAGAETARWVRISVYAGPGSVLVPNFLSVSEVRVLAL